MDRECRFVSPLRGSDFCEPVSRCNAESWLSGTDVLMLSDTVPSSVRAPLTLRHCAVLVPEVGVASAFVFQLGKAVEGKFQRGVASSPMPIWPALS